MSYPNTPSTITSVLSQFDKNNVVHYGMADLSGGLIQIDQINGYGLMTNGFLWQFGEIWFYPEDAAPLNTTWVNSRSFGDEIPD